MAGRFRGLLPVVVDIETTGLDPVTAGLLEIAAVPLKMDSMGKLHPLAACFYPVDPHPEANIDPEALLVTGIDPESALRGGISEHQVLNQLFLMVQKWLKESCCQRAILVGHNAWFDLAFLRAAAKRSGFKKTPFHAFTTIDTASLAAVFLGETVLAKALRRAGIGFDIQQAHSAVYDATKTAKLFCHMVNAWQFF